MTETVYQTEINTAVEDTLLAERAANGLEKFWSGDHVSKEMGLCYLDLGVVDRGFEPLHAH